MDRRAATSLERLMDGRIDSVVNSFRRWSGTTREAG
jgi:hypothetical protein